MLCYFAMVLVYKTEQHQKYYNSFQHCPLRQLFILPFSILFFFNRDLGETVLLCNNADKNNYFNFLFDCYFYSENEILCTSIVQSASLGNSCAKS